MKGYSWLILLVVFGAMACGDTEDVEPVTYAQTGMSLECPAAKYEYPAYRFEYKATKNKGIKPDADWRNEGDFMVLNQDSVWEKCFDDNFRRSATGGWRDEDVWSGTCRHRFDVTDGSGFDPYPRFLRMAWVPNNVDPSTVESCLLPVIPEEQLTID